jgi:hypothetical protein
MYIEARAPNTSANAPSCVTGMLQERSPTDVAAGAGEAVCVGVGEGSTVLVAVAGIAVASSGVRVAVGFCVTGAAKPGVGISVGIAVRVGSELAVGAGVGLSLGVGVSSGSNVGELTIGGSATAGSPEPPTLHMDSNVREDGPVEPSPQTHPSTSPFFSILAATPTPEYVHEASSLPVK